MIGLLLVMRALAVDASCRAGVPVCTPTSTSPLCQLVASAPGTETEESLTAFLGGLERSVADPQWKADLLCARLIGRKVEIEGRVDLYNRYDRSAGLDSPWSPPLRLGSVAEVIPTYTSAELPRIKANLQELVKLGAAPTEEATARFVGVVRAVEIAGYPAYRVAVDVSSVTLSGEFGTGSPATWAAATNQRLRDRALELLNLGRP